MKKDKKSFTLYYIGLFKQSRRGKVNPVVQLHMYSPDSDTCVLSEYIKRASSLRGCERNLLISYIKPCSIYNCK